jgi:alanine-synthesizing transaminase
VALAKRYDVLVVHDLAYADIVYDGWKAPLSCRSPARAMSPSNSLRSLTIWRAGVSALWSVTKRWLMRWRVLKATTLRHPLQVAAIAALEGDQQCVRDIAEQYKRRRDVLVKGLHEAGWMVECPKASMYVWAKIPEQYAAMGSLEFAKKLLQDAKVCVSPGIGLEIMAIPMYASL